MKMKPRIIAALVVLGCLLSSPSLRADDIRFEVESVGFSTDMSTGARGVMIRLKPIGIAASRVQSGRALITRAQDDAGLDLKQEGTPAFYHVTAGSVKGDDSSVSSRQPLSFALTPLAKAAKMLNLVEGKVELFVPDIDPNSTVTVVDISSQFGSPNSSPILSEAGITLTVFDQKSRDKYKTGDGSTVGGPQAYDEGPMFGSRPDLPEPMRSRFMKGLETDQNDFAVGIVDRQHRLLAVEFQTAEGGLLTYNHNGSYHSSGTESNGKRFDVYHIENLPKRARFVCWLITPKSVVTVPLKLSDIVLPQP